MERGWCFLKHLSLELAALADEYLERPCDIGHFALPQ
jgi:hypothetical protein